MITLTPKGTSLYKDLVPILVKVVGDTQGIVRKNAATCLGKLCQDKENLDLAKQIHGPDLLMQLHKYVMETGK